MGNSFLSIEKNLLSMKNTLLSMKKSLVSMFAVAAGLLMATSCSTKQEDVKTDGEATVTFVAQVPSGINHRAPQKTTGDDGTTTTTTPTTTTTTTTFSDGLKATELQYAVYEVSDDAQTGETWTWIKSLGTENLTLTDLKATLTLNLVNGKKYAVAFWAAAPGSKVYYFDKEKIAITANYDGVLSSNDELDAFYAVAKFTVNGASQQTVELYRPFAQLNIGTADLTASAELGHTVSQAAVKVAAYTTLNLKSEEVEGDAAEVTFNLAALPKATFPVTGNDYLAMNYLLMPKDKSTANVTISYDAAAGLDARTFNNVPLQRNFRTNIYGKLLTSATEVDVVVKPETEGDITYSSFTVADGKTVAFSKGNLQYTKSTETWSFAENQYDMIGAANIDNGVLADKIDLFGWSCKGHEWGNSISATFAGADFVDWGEKIDGYRTLTADEWDYLLYSRANASEKYGAACIKIDDATSVNGIILLPDSWTLPEGVTFTSGLSTNTSTDAADYATHKTYTLDEWKKLEAAGAVFLPAAGRREGTEHNEKVYGFYWSSDLTSRAFGTMSWAFALQVTPNYFRDTQTGNIENSMASHLLQTNFGCSVRLVQDL